LLDRSPLRRLRLSQCLLVLMISLSHLIMEDASARIQCNPDRVGTGGSGYVLSRWRNEALSPDIWSGTRAPRRGLRTITARPMSTYPGMAYGRRAVETLPMLIVQTWDVDRGLGRRWSMAGLYARSSTVVPADTLSLPRQRLLVVPENIADNFCPRRDSWFGYHESGGWWVWRRRPTERGVRTNHHLCRVTIIMVRGRTPVCL
jgi:hypothetical protein